MTRVDLRSLRGRQLCRELKDECPKQAKVLRRVGEPGSSQWSKRGEVEGGER